MIVSRIYDLFVDLVCYHDIVSNVDHTSSYILITVLHVSLSSQVLFVGGGGGWVGGSGRDRWAWERSRSGECRPSTHRLIVAGSTRCTLVLRVRMRACVPEPSTDDHAARGREGFRGAFLRGDRRFARRVVSRIRGRGVHVSGNPDGQTG